MTNLRSRITMDIGSALTVTLVLTMAIVVAKVGSRFNITIAMNASAKGLMMEDIIEQISILKQMIINNEPQKNSSFSFKHGNIEVSSEKISLVSNTDNSILSIRMEDFDGYNFRSQKILIHQDLNYAFRLGCGGMTIMIIGWLLLISFLPDGNAGNILSEVVLYLGGIPLFIGGVLIIALLVNSLFGIDLYSKILINAAGKNFNVLTILSKKSSENITLFTTDLEMQNLDMLIERLSKFSVKDHS